MRAEVDGLGPRNAQTQELSRGRTEAWERRETGMDALPRTGGARVTSGQVCRSVHPNGLYVFNGGWDVASSLTTGQHGRCMSDGTGEHAGYSFRESEKNVVAFFFFVELKYFSYRSAFCGAAADGGPVGPTSFRGAYFSCTFSFPHFHTPVPQLAHLSSGHRRVLCPRATLPLPSSHGHVPPPLPLHNCPCPQGNALGTYVILVSILLPSPCCNLVVYLLFVGVQVLVQNRPSSYRTPVQ